MLIRLIPFVNRENKKIRETAARSPGVGLFSEGGGAQYLRMTATTLPRMEQPSPSMGWYSGLEFSG